MASPPNPDFNPLKVTGAFWLVFGTVLLAVTPWVEGSQYVPRERGMAANLAAASFLMFLGGFCLVRSRRAGA